MTGPAYELRARKEGPREWWAECRFPDQTSGPWGGWFLVFDGAWFHTKKDALAMLDHIREIYPDDEDPRQVTNRGTMRLALRYAAETIRAGENSAD